MAEEEYFTWIDAQGRIHNTLKTTPADNSQSDSPEKNPASEHDEFLTEEEFTRQKEQDAKDNPPFYIWIDSLGQRHSELMTPEQVEAEEAAQSQNNVSSEKIIDHALIPPLRLPDSVRSGSCCRSYAAFFRELLEPEDSVLFTLNSTDGLFRAGDEAVPAWYFKTTASKSRKYLNLKLRHSRNSLSVIAVDAQYRPLHHIQELSFQDHPETWAYVAYRESLVEINDPDVAGFIVVFPYGYDAKATLEVSLSAAIGD